MAPPASSKPALPAKKGTKGAKNSTGDAYSNTVTLPDGSKVRTAPLGGWLHARTCLPG